MTTHKDNPLAEIFGFPVENVSERARYYRENRLCPFNNRCPNCTKDKADDPLGVCSVNNGGFKVITCPSRFREDWLILQRVIYTKEGSLDDFISLLQEKLDERTSNSPETHSAFELL